MAAETISPEAPSKFSRYRSVRRAQTRQQENLIDIQEAPPMPTMPMPTAPIHPQQDATVSRSMSRYHRRPTTSHAPAAKGPPVRSNTDIVPPLPASAPNAASAARSRALSSPHHAPRAAHNDQPQQPNTTRPLTSKGGRRATQNAQDEAKRLLDWDKERQRRIQEQQKAEKRARLEAEEKAEGERQENLRREKEEQEQAEAERLRAQRDAEEAEQLRRQQEEQERGRRLQKAESAARLKKREEEARKAQVALPPTSPPRHGGGFGLFHRKRKDDVPNSPPRPVDAGRPRQTSNGQQRDLDNIRIGGGGAVLGIDAPVSAVNAGDRVCIHLSIQRVDTNLSRSVFWFHAGSSKLCSL